MIIIFIWMSLALFGSSQSATFECQYASFSWGTLGTVYVCNVPNFPNVIALDAAQIDSISGQHQAGFNNDNVEVFDVYQKAPINYFPRGLTKFFKNIKAISISNDELKEIHQSDLKDFPKLMIIYLFNNNLEIIEENLFEFNPNLQWIDLYGNQISHIDPNVFNKLLKLNPLKIGSNPCINMEAHNPTDLQNLIKATQAQCTNLDYSNLEQKVKYLEFESSILDSETLNQKVEHLESEIQNSRFANFFQEKLASLYAVVIQKEREDIVDSKLTNIEQIVANITPGNEMGNKNNIVLNIS